MISYFKKTAVTIGRTLLLLSSALCTLLFSVLLVVQTIACDRDLFVSAAEDPAYNKQLLSSVSKSVESECLFYGVEFSYVKDCLSDETITEYAKQYLGTIYDSISTGKAVEDVVVSKNVFMPGVDRFFASLGEYGTKIDLETRTEIASSLAMTTTNVLHTIPYSEKVADLYAYTYGHPLFSYINPALWVLGIASVVLLIAAFISDYKRPFVSLQRLVGAVWCAEAVCYVPVTLLDKADLPSKLAFEGTLKALATSLVQTILTRMEHLLGIAFWVLTGVLLAVSVYLLIRHFRSLPSCA